MRIDTVQISIPIAIMWYFGNCQFQRLYNDHVYAKFEFTVTVYYGLWGKTSSWVSLKTPDDILLFKINLTLFCNASTQ